LRGTLYIEAFHVEGYLIYVEGYPFYVEGYVEGCVEGTTPITPLSPPLLRLFPVYVEGVEG